VRIKNRTSQDAKKDAPDFFLLVRNGLLKRAPMRKKHVKHWHSVTILRKSASA